MLTALEQGVLGGQWYSWMDKVYALPNLRPALARVKANEGAAGVDHVTVKEFERHLEENLEKLSRSLKDGSYRPQAVRRKWINKLGSKQQRPLGIPTVRDRVVQGAVRAVPEPSFERDFAAQSYGFRPNRGCKDALRRVNTLLREGHHWVVDADLKSYFDTLPHSSLIAPVKEKVADSQVLGLLAAFLTAKVMETAKGWTPEEGTPQGAVISRLLSHLYLDPLDQLMARVGFEMVRYADDFVSLCRSEAEALERVQSWTVEAGLRLHPVKTRIVDATQRGGFDFLGYHFERGYRWPRQQSLDKFKDTIRAKTRPVNGRSLRALLVNLNRTRKGWFEYFKHSRKSTFADPDRWVAEAAAQHPPQTAGQARRCTGLGQCPMATGFLCEAGAVLLGRSPRLSSSILSEVKLPTGEPDAGDPPVRFGGRGDRDHPVLSTPIFFFAAREEVGS